MAASNPLKCHVHPVVLFSIVDSFERRSDENCRVIGTLLGTNIHGSIEVTNCFCVPHNESEDEVAVDMEFAKNMYDLHRKVNPVEMIVGWYATGPDITDHSVLIHDYYSKECFNPVHITVDTTVENLRMSMTVWVRQNMGVPEKSQGTVFVPIPLKITCHEPERVALDTLIRGKSSGERNIALIDDLSYVSKAANKLQDLLDVVLNYVDEVIAGRISADNQVGRYLMDLVAKVPKLQPEDLDQMLNNSMKDLLMVTYLSQLVSTQLSLNENLTSMVSKGIDKF
ncbi:eukaryotic translation initiation factor 3 subunit F-like [Apostichopus japonicus]|uniref:eukaryotic translation initiation factor 3 subunit F-like n=1 Tax=Stichopus japonicus TaxID=307972 RepID=UPI003AB66B80